MYHQREKKKNASKKEKKKNEWLAFEDNVFPYLEEDDLSLVEICRNMYARGQIKNTTDGDLKKQVGKKDQALAHQLLLMSKRGTKRIKLFRILHEGECGEYFDHLFRGWHVGRLRECAKMVSEDQLMKQEFYRALRDHILNHVNISKEFLEYLAKYSRDFLEHVFEKLDPKHCNFAALLRKIYQVQDVQSLHHLALRCPSGLFYEYLKEGGKFDFNELVKANYPLHRVKNVTLAKLFVENGVEIDLLNCAGETPLIAQMKDGSCAVSVCNYLIGLGCSLKNIASLQTLNPFVMYAIMQKHSFASLGLDGNSCLKKMASSGYYCEAACFARDYKLVSPPLRSFWFCYPNEVKRNVVTAMYGMGLSDVDVFENGTISPNPKYCVWSERTHRFCSAELREKVMCALLCLRRYRRLIPFGKRMYILKFAFTYVCDFEHLLVE